MATNFPSSVDSFTNPTTSDTLASVSHSAQHSDVNDAVEAIETALLDGAPLHIDDANERVGIGTTSPDVPLHVDGDAGNNEIAKLQSSQTAATYSLVGITDANETAKGFIGFNPGASLNNTDSYLMLGMNGDDVNGGTGVIVKKGGKVGIGTTSPVQELHVYTGSANADARLQGDPTGYMDVYHGPTLAGLHASNAVTMRFATNNVTRMSIDSSGRVTQPYQPSFKAYTNAGQINNPTPGYLVFNNTSYAGGHNVGNHYSTSTGLFTAPVAGVYHFGAAMLTNNAFSSQTYVRIFWRINGADAHYFAHNHTGDWVMESGSIYLSLAANDTVGLYITLGSGHYGTYSYFSGRLVG